MIKTVLAATIALFTASAAFATEFDGNLTNRYAGFAGASQSLQTKNVAMTSQVAGKIDREGANHDRWAIVCGVPFWRDSVAMRWRRWWQDYQLPPEPGA